MLSYMQRPEMGQSAQLAYWQLCSEGVTRMDITLLLLADYANISQEGKLNVMGIFDRISVQSLPAQHPEMRLVMRLSASPAEKGQQKSVEVKLIDADGNANLTAAASLVVPSEAPQLTIEIVNILTLVGVRFAKAGSYAFHVLINGDDKGRVPFTVVQRQRDSQTEEV